MRFVSVVFCLFFSSVSFAQTCQDLYSTFAQGGRILFYIPVPAGDPAPYYEDQQSPFGANCYFVDSADLDEADYQSSGWDIYAYFFEAEDTYAPYFATNTVTLPQYAFTSSSDAYNYVTSNPLSTPQEPCPSGENVYLTFNNVIVPSLNFPDTIRTAGSQSEISTDSLSIARGHVYFTGTGETCELELDDYYSSSLFGYSNHYSTLELQYRFTGEYSNVLDDAYVSFEFFTDTDGDNVPDEYDDCPTVAGTADNPEPDSEGCPEVVEVDTDGDGTPDSLDQCPDTGGEILVDGCPDTDGDGVHDHQDECPNDATDSCNQTPDDDEGGSDDENPDTDSSGILQALADLKNQNQADAEAQNQILGDILAAIESDEETDNTGVVDALNSIDDTLSTLEPSADGSIDLSETNNKLGDLNSSVNALNDTIGDVQNDANTDEDGDGQNDLKQQLEGVAGNFGSDFYNIPIIKAVMDISLNSSAQCSPFQIDNPISNEPINTDFHCELLGDIGGVLSTLMVVVWSIVAVRLFLD